MGLVQRYMVEECEYIKVVYRLPATGSRSPWIASGTAMIGWHVAHYWAAGDGGWGGSLLSRWCRPLCDE